MQDVLEALENRAAALQVRSVTAYGKERWVLRGAVCLSAMQQAGIVR